MATISAVLAALNAIIAIANAATNLWYDSSAGATAVNVKGSSTTAYAVYIDNTLNAAISYFKMYNNAAPTIGTTAPDEIIMVAASSKITIPLQTGNPPVPGKVFATALSYACVTAGGTAGTTAPTSAVPVEIAFI